MPQPGPIRILAMAEWALLGSLLALFIATGFVPAWRTLNTDFPNYYIAASLRRRGLSLERAYEWLWFQRQKDHLAIDYPLVGFMPNPPMCAVPILPLARFPALTAKRVWLILNLGLLFLATWILHGVTILPWRRVALISFLCVLPLRMNFICGQYYVVILVLICSAYYAWLRGHKIASGLVLAAAASLKLFPAAFLIFFLWKRDWRAGTGLVLGGIVLTGASVGIFGWEVHRVWLIEVLPRALHGDIIDPYALQWASFSALSHRLFLSEPELNPSPLFNSPVIYALTLAVVPTVLIFSFLLMTGRDQLKRAMALEWAVFVPLLLLLSSMPSHYHYCVLIFAAVVAADALLKIADKRVFLVFILLFGLACTPVPDALLGGSLVLMRLFATLGLYVFILCQIVLLRRTEPQENRRTRAIWYAVAALMCVALVIANLNSTRHRMEDFRRRLALLSPGYSASYPVAIGQQIVFTEMLDDKYGAESLKNGKARSIPIPGDVLSLAGSAVSHAGYFEQVTLRSSILQLSPEDADQGAGFVAEGEQPSVSPNGKWLAFLQGEGAKRTIRLQATDSGPAVWQNGQNILEITVTNQGDVIASSGPASEPHLVLVRRETGVIEPLNEIAGPARYPTISPDGRRLAFSRRKGGSWQLILREFRTGSEQQLTDAPCNATLPSWGDSHTLLYATDCGRGLGLTALARLALPD